MTPETKDIRNYIHLYLGCDTDQGKLIGIEMNKAICMMDDLSVVAGNIYNLKPILRRLDSMTEDEARKLAIIYSGDNECERVNGTASNWWYFQCFRNEDSDHTLVIGSTGEAWYRHYFDRESTGHRNTVNHHEATQYLLLKHFDLFGLIDAGLAVEKK